MEIKLLWSHEALNDIEQIAEYISRDSKNYANAFVQTVLDKLNNVKIFPKSGRIVPEFNNESLREIFVYNYRVIYEQNFDSVIVLSIIHGKRDLNLTRDS